MSHNGQPFAPPAFRVVMPESQHVSITVEHSPGGGITITARSRGLASAESVLWTIRAGIFSLDYNHEAVARHLAYFGGDSIGEISYD